MPFTSRRHVPPPVNEPVKAYADHEVARHVEGYACEWKGVLEDPDKLSRFVSFVNAPDAVDPTIGFTERSGRKVPTELGVPAIPKC